MNDHTRDESEPSVSTAAKGKEPWTAPTLRCLSAKDAETGIVFGPEILILLS